MAARMEHRFRWIGQHAIAQSTCCIARWQREVDRSEKGDALKRLSRFARSNEPVQANS
jgi:hypothetical protein